MAYLPKSQITLKYTDPPSNSETHDNIEYQYLSNGKLYNGPYLESSTGIKYAGISNLVLGPQIVPISNIKTDKILGDNLNVDRFNVLKSDIKSFLSKTIPIPSIKKYPLETNYNNGYFLRYFSKRINSSGYQEIDKEIYNDIKNKKGTYDYNLYEIGSIKWKLKGNVFKDNALALQKLERTFKNISYLFPVFDEFAREPIQNQENLYTKGGELYYGDGTEYIGAYHIHTTKGPMVGAYHTEVTHPKLYYISELPKPDNMSYEDFLSNYPPPTITPLIPLDPLDRDPRELISNDGRGTLSPSPGSYNCITSWGPPPPGYLGLVLNTGENNGDGLVALGSTCVDPGDGTGTYSPNDYGSYWEMACHNSCEGANINDTSTGDVGCLVPWDANYCSNCSVHDPDACASIYGFGGSSAGSGGGSYGGGGTFLGNTCFTSETSIIMEDETVKRIDEVKVGDIVKSEINTSNVIGIDIHKEKEHTIYSINNSEAFVTAEHPFKTTTGWKAIDPLETFKTHGIESNVLEIGDTLITKEGTEEVKSIEKSTKTTDTVYNLRLDNEHVYYANGYLVHNNKFGGMGLDDLEGLAETWNEEMGYDFGGFTAEQCPCGIFNGIMLYASCCCDESC